MLLAGSSFNVTCCVFVNALLSLSTNPLASQYCTPRDFSNLSIFRLNDSQSLRSGSIPTTPSEHYCPPQEAWLPPSSASYAQSSNVTTRSRPSLPRLLRCLHQQEPQTMIALPFQRHSAPSPPSNSSNASSSTSPSLLSSRLSASQRPSTLRFANLRLSITASSFQQLTTTIPVIRATSQATTSGTHISSAQPQHRGRSFGVRKFRGEPTRSRSMMCAPGV